MTNDMTGIGEAKNGTRSIDQDAVGFDLLKFSATSQGKSTGPVSFPELIGGFRFIRTHPIPSHPNYGLRTELWHPNGMTLEFHHARRRGRKASPCPIWQCQFRAGIYVLLDQDMETMVRTVRDIEHRFNVILRMSKLEIAFDIPTHDQLRLRDFFRHCKTRTKKGKKSNKGRYNDTAKVECGISRGRIEVRWRLDTLKGLGIERVEDLPFVAYSTRLFRYYISWVQGPTGGDRDLRLATQCFSKSARRKHRRRLRPHPIQHEMEQLVEGLQDRLRRV